MFLKVTAGCTEEQGLGVQIEHQLMPNYFAMNHYYFSLLYIAITITLHYFSITLVYYI